MGAKAFRDLLADGDLSAEEVSKELGVARTTVWRWAKGLSVPRVPTAEALVRAYGRSHGVSLDSIFRPSSVQD